ncbi:MAG: hypothetical protein L6R36_005955 [Xanthoria steineri]|nr:MAG: hypothetical protein L6R36_005955 [Xanthoria steineri]
MYSIRRALGASLLIACASSQTPPGSTPATNNQISVQYGSTPVTPGIMLEKTQTSTIPTFNYIPSSPDQIYTLLLIDLSIPASNADPSKLAPEQLPLAPGIAPNRTTRLHFWQAGLTFAPNGTLLNTTQPVASYKGPMPPAGDTPHDYVFYLFQQEAGFAPPAANSPFNANNVDKSPINRSSFNVQRFAEGEGVGDLVAANYIMVQTPASGGSGGGGMSMSNSTAGPSATATTGGMAPASPSPFTGSAGKLGAPNKTWGSLLLVLTGFLLG